VDNLKLNSGREKDNKNICGKRIKELRRNMQGSKNRMTQDDLAAKLQLCGGNFERTTISHIENGSRGVADYELVQIAYVLGVDLNALVCGQLTVSETVRLILEKISAQSDDGSDAGSDFDENMFAAEGGQQQR